MADCIIIRRKGEGPFVRDNEGNRSRLFDQIAGIPVISNIEDAVRLYSSVHADTFKDEAGDWTAAVPVNKSYAQAVSEQFERLGLPNKAYYMQQANRYAQPQLVTPVMDGSSIKFRKGNDIDPGNAYLLDMSRISEANMGLSDEVKLGEIINNKNEIDYERLEQATDDILEGRARLGRFNKEEERGRIKGGRLHVEASILLGASESAVRSQQREETIIRQNNLLKEWGIRNNLIISDDYIRENLTQMSFGRESIVYSSEAEKEYVTKITRWSMSQNPLDFLDRMALHNRLFSETSIIMQGLYLDTGTGAVSFVLKQPFIQGEEVDPIELKNAIEALGFKHIFPILHLYEYADYRVSDLHNGNVLHGEDGEWYFIDTNPILDWRKGREKGDFNIEYERGTGLRYRKSKDDRVKIEEIINNKNKIDYERLEQAANDILEGKARLERFNAEEEGGRIEGGRFHVEASVLLGANDRTIRKGQIEKRISSQIKLLTDWANKRGRLFSSEFIQENFLELGNGIEAVVFSCTIQFTRVSCPLRSMSVTGTSTLLRSIPLHNSKDMNTISITSKKMFHDINNFKAQVYHFVK